jgi:hypothetical protein
MLNQRSKSLLVNLNSYRPASREGKEYSPELLVVALRWAAVASFRIETIVPGMTAPVESFTVPVIVPVA